MDLYITLSPKNWDSVKGKYNEEIISTPHLTGYSPKMTTEIDVFTTHAPNHELSLKCYLD